MLTGLSLQGLASKVAGMRDLKADFISDTRNLSMVPQTDGGVAVLDRQTEHTFPVLPLAHDQIGARLNIPRKYYDRMLQQAPELLAINANAWFTKQPEQRMLRTLGGDLRAFLSNRYQRIENEEILGAALPALQTVPGLTIRSCEVTERRLYVEAVTDRIQRDVKVGDAVQAGVIISNSEVGCGAVAVRPVVFRLRCLNGMVCKDESYRAQHVGRKVEDNEALWADDTRQADDRAVLLKVRDMVRHAVDEVAFARRVDRMTALAGTQLTGDPLKATQLLAQKVDFSESETGALLKHLIGGGDLSAWGMLNAVTAMAHEAPTYERNVEYQELGGQLLQLPASEWREIMTVAA